jgi:hypothetical protein
MLGLVLLSSCVMNDRPRRDPMDDYYRMPIPRGNIKVNIDTFEFLDRDTDAFDLALRYRDSSVSAGIGDIYRTNGLIAFAAQKNFVAAFRAQSTKFRSSRHTTSFLVMANESEGRLQVFEQAPVPVLHVIPIYSGAVLVRTVEYRVLGSGLYVRPVSVGPTSVQLEVTPFLSYEDAGAPSITRIVELTTRMVAEDGRPYVIMGSNDQSQSVGAAMFSYRSQTTSRRMLQVLTVEIGK